MSWGYDPPEVEVLEGEIQRAFGGIMVELEPGVWVRPDAVVLVEAGVDVTRVTLAMGGHIDLAGNVAASTIEKLGILTP